MKRDSVLRGSKDAVVTVAKKEAKVVSMRGENP